MWKRQLFHAIGITIVGISAGTLLQAEAPPVQQKAFGCGTVCTTSCPADQQATCASLETNCVLWIICDETNSQGCAAGQVATGCGPRPY